MEHYTLQPDEAMLYHADTFVLYDGKQEKTTLLLTDKFFVFIVKRKKFLIKEEVTVEALAVDTVKLYKDAPNIIRKDNVVEVYFIGAERIISFYDKSEAKKFVAKALELLTKKNAFFRGIDKAKRVIEQVDESLGIDSVGIAKNVAEKGVAKALLLGKDKQKGKTETTTEVVKSAGGIFRRKETKQLPPMSPQEQAEAVERLKQMLDNGVITQEEFDIKKKEYLGL